MLGIIGAMDEEVAGSLTVALIKKSFNPLYSLCFLCQTFRFDI